MPVWLWTLLLAPIAGSVAGVLARRLPRGEPVGLARSACESCKTPLGATDLVPLVSYAVLRGNCRHCGAPIGWYHPAMELAALLTALWALSVFDGAVLLASCLLGWMLLALAVCDARSYLLPDALTLSLLLMGLGATYWLQPDALDEHAVAATLGYVVFRGIDMGYFWLRGRHGLGQGDAKLLAAAGAWLGLEALPQVVLIAAVIGLLLAAVMAWRGQRVRAQMRLPFGPPLALATWLVWLYF